MNYLLDSHTFLWWVDDSRQLSDISREIIHDGSNRIFLSLASQWEIGIKVSIGRLEFPMDQLEDTVEQNGFELLAMTTKHIIESTSLPMHHRDPFDRMLIAQARLESLTLISKDAVFPDYDVALVW